MAPVAAALQRVRDYGELTLARAVGELLEASGLGIACGSKILVKPNLLMAHELACTNPAVVVALCKWLLDYGARIIIADSPAFGTAVSVSRAIGLTDALAPLGLRVSNFMHGHMLNLALPGGETASIKVAADALECDQIISVPKVKAHSQLRMTLAVKNCFGCIPGIRKALTHVRFGTGLKLFTDFIAALWAALPPVAALADGIIAMHKTGPRSGEPFHLNLLGASPSAVALDQAILEVLNIPQTEIPLTLALGRRGEMPEILYPVMTPGEFNVRGFVVPEKLREISFSPFVLGKSIIRRLWSGFGR